MNTLIRLTLLGAAALSLSACFDKEPATDQASLCTFNTDPQAERCKAGQTAWFRPEQAVSEETLLSVAAAYCDFNHTVMYNRAGVVCVFTKERLSAVK